MPPDEMTVTEIQQHQLDRIEKKIDDMAKSVSSHRAEIKWIKATMAAFFSTILTVAYKVFKF